MTPRLDGCNIARQTGRKSSSVRHAVVLVILTSYYNKSVNTKPRFCPLASEPVVDKISMSTPIGSSGYLYDEIGAKTVKRATEYNDETERLLNDSTALEAQTNSAFVQIKRPKRKLFRRLCGCLPCCKPKPSLDDPDI